VAFTKGVLSAVKNTPGQLFNDILLLISKLADRAKSSDSAPDWVILELFLGLTTVPNANQLALSTLKHFARTHPESVLESMFKTVSTQAMSDVVAFHSCVLRSALPPSLVNTCFSNMLQACALRPILVSEKPMVGVMLENVADIFPDAVFGPLGVMFESDNPEDVKKGVLHCIALESFHHKNAISHRFFTSILTSASPLGKMVFMWEATSKLTMCAERGRLSHEADREYRILNKRWSSEVESVIQSGIFAESEPPVLTMLGKLLYQLWTASPSTRERPSWTNIVLQWGQRKGNPDHEYHELWNDFDTVYQLINDMQQMSGQNIDNMGDSTDDLVMMNMCPWGARQLMLDENCEVMDGRNGNILDDDAFCSAAAKHFANREKCRRDDLLAISVLLLERLSQFLLDKELQSISVLPWYNLSYVKDDRVVRAASLMMMTQAQLFPSGVRELLCINLYNDNHTLRADGLHRFAKLWAHRKHLSSIYSVMYSSMLKPTPLPEPLVGILTDEDVVDADPGAMLPPILGIAVFPIIDLCLDNSTDVAMMARKTLGTCLAEHPELFLRVTFEQAGHVGDTARSQMLARAMSISQQLYAPPALYVVLMFNFIVSLLVDVQQNGSAFEFPFDALRSIPLLTKLVPRMQWLRVKDIRAKARAPFLVQIFDLALESDDGSEKSRRKQHKINGNSDQWIDAEEFFTHSTSVKSFVSIFPDGVERPCKYQNVREVSVFMSEMTHQTKLMFLLRVIEDFPDQTPELKSKLLGEFQWLIQEVLIDCYRQHTEAKSHHSGDTKKADPLFILQQIKHTMPAMINDLIGKTRHATHYLWLMLGKALLPSWDDCGYVADDKSVHALVALITGLNMLILKHRMVVSTVVQVVTLYCQLVLQHFRFFRHDGYRHFLPILTKVYELRSSNPETKAVMEFAFGHFYRLHGQAFILQVIACLSPSSVGDVLVVNTHTLVSMIACLRSGPASSKYNDICWSPELTGEAHFNLEDLVKIQVCLIIHSPTLPGTAVFFEMLDHLIPGLQVHPEWQAQEGKKFLAILSRLFESLDPNVYNIRFDSVPLRYKICLFKFLQRLGHIDLALYEKYYGIAHLYIVSMLVEAIELDQERCVAWLREYCHVFLANLDPEQVDVFGPIQTLIPEILQVYKLAPQWSGWASVFDSINVVLQKHPDPCTLVAKDLLMVLSDTLWRHEEYEPRLVFSVIDLFGFVACNEPHYDSSVPSAPVISASTTKNPGKRAAVFIANVILPLAHSMSGHASFAIQSGWSWPVEFLVTCLHEKYAVEEALLALEICLLYGHPSLGAWSASITSVLAMLLAAQQDNPTSRLARALQRMLHFTTLLKPDVYNSLLTLIRRNSPASMMITHPGSGEIPLQQVFKLTPCTTSEMFHWLEPDLALFSKWNRGVIDRKNEDAEADMPYGTVIGQMLHAV